MKELFPCLMMPWAQSEIMDVCFEIFSLLILTVVLEHLLYVYKF